MEWVALHKIVLLVTAYCTIQAENYTYIPNNCQSNIVKIASKNCNLNKDEYHICYGKVKKNLHNGYTFNTDNANITLKPLKETSIDRDGE